MATTKKVQKFETKITEKIVEQPIINEEVYSVTNNFPIEETFEAEIKDFNINSVPEINETIDNDLKKEMEEEGVKIITELVNEKILEELINLADKPEVSIKRKRDISDLNLSELRLYQRSGIIPD